MPDTSKPLITLMVISYNQERYIAQALEGAFAQTYSPLEILLSDDCSTDGTFQIMQKMADGYRGPHHVRLNRNERNLGFGGHIDRIMELSRGELIVAAAGDDISLPQRVEKVWQAYVESDGRAMSIYSSFIVIDEHGVRQETVGRPPGRTATDIEAYLAAGCVSGCSHAWHRCVFDVFGPMVPGTVLEDKAIPLRSLMLGEIRYVDEPLVLYRRHSQNITAIPEGTSQDFDIGTYTVKRQRRRLLTLKNHERDLLRQHELIRIGVDTRNRLAASIRRRIRRSELEIAFNEGTWKDRIGVIRQGLSARVGLGRVATWCLQLVWPYHLRRARRRLLKRAAGD